MSEQVLREGGEWATGSLLDPSNVGKYVWPVWNSNRFRGERPAVIVKVTRTNVHVHSSSATPWSLRVDTADDGVGFAHGSKNGYSIAVETQEYRQQREDFSRLYDKIRNLRWNRVPIDVLRQVVALVDPDA